MENEKSKSRAKAWDTPTTNNHAMQLGGVGQAAPEQVVPGAAPPTMQQIMAEVAKKTTVDTLNAFAQKGFFKGKGKGGKPTNKGDGKGNPKGGKPGKGGGKGKGKPF